MKKNNYLDKIINKHNNLVNEILYGHLNILKESKQLIPNIRTYYDVIWNKVSAITGLKKDGDYLRNCKSKEFSIEINEQDFNGIETFFKKLDFKILLNVSNFSNTYEYEGGYNPQKSLTDALSGNIYSMVEGDKLPKVVIYAIIETSIYTIQEAIAACVYHEFTHAYEDFQRIKKNNRANSMATYSIYSNYDKINVIRNSVPRYGQALGDIIYLLKQIELNAYVSQSIGEIEVKMIKNGDILPELIQSTIGYKNYKALFSLIGGLKNLSNQNIQNELLIAFNNNAGIIGKYNGQNKKYSFKNYYQMVKWLEKKAKYTYNQFIERIARHFEDFKIRNKFLIN